MPLEDPQSKIDVSVVIPTYNEIQNVGILIPMIEDLLKKNLIKGEIIVVDDYSPDGTAHEVRKINKKYGNIRVISKEKEGIGSALRTGYNNSRGELILSSDADLSFQVKDMKRLIDKIGEGYDLVVGNRHSSSEDYQKENFNTKMKGFVSYFGNIMVRIISGIQIHDFSANFRVIRKDVWESIDTKENTNSILFEMILKTHRKGFKVGEISVIFRDRVYGESKLNLAIEAPKFFAKLIKYTLKGS